MKKLWVLGIYENETDKEPTRQGYAVANTLEAVELIVRNCVPGVYKLITLDISEVSTFDPSRFPPNGILWTPVEQPGFQTKVNRDMPKG